MTAATTDRQHGVQRALAAAHAAVQQSLDAPMWPLSDEQTRAALSEAATLSATAHAAYLRLLREASGRDDPAARADTPGWLAGEQQMSVGRVRADLRAADVLAAELPEMGRELAAGGVTREHVDVAVRALDGVPARLRRDRAADLYELLTEHARQFDPPMTRKLARHLLDAVDPDRTDRLDIEAHVRREAHLAVDSTGMGVLRAQLEAGSTAQLKAVLDHLCAPHRDDGEPAVERRTAAQRRADALGEMARIAAGALEIGVRAGEPPRVVVHTTLDQLAGHRGSGAASCEQTGPITPATLDALACEAVVERVVLDERGRVVSLTSLGRFFTASQRRALAARDGGCAFPGCGRPPSWTDAHHVVAWSRGGPTAVDNGVLVCGPHHTEVHVGEWSVVAVDGVPWFVPPRTVDPAQRPVRNTVHDAVSNARQVGHRLAQGP